MSIVFDSTDRQECVNYVLGWASDNGRQDIIERLNLLLTVRRGKSVICHQTGEIFQTMKEACDAHQLTYTALYRHLNKVTGHKTVKGRTYAFRT